MCFFAFTLQNYKNFGKYASIFAKICYSYVSFLYFFLHLPIIFRIFVGELRKSQVC